MTKREMIEEIADGVELPHKELSIQMRMNNSKSRIKLVYEFYLKNSHSKENKIFCLKLL